jgi:hypothetical protein
LTWLTEDFRLKKTSNYGDAKKSYYANYTNQEDSQIRNDFEPTSGFDGHFHNPAATTAFPE